MYYYEEIINKPFNEAINIIKEKISNKGFGVITEINMQEKIKEKTGKEITPYIILGICNPLSAYEALKKEENVGLLLPCKIILKEKEGKTSVAMIKPTTAMKITDNEELTPIAEEIEEKMKKAIEEAVKV